jgi:hypothetical protein
MNDVLDFITAAWLIFLFIGVVGVIIQLVALYKEHGQGNKNNFGTRLVMILVIVGISVYIALNIPNIFFNVPNNVYNKLQSKTINQTTMNNVSEIVEWVGNDKENLAIATNILTRQDYFADLRGKVVITETTFAMIILILLSKPQHDPFVTRDNDNK